MRHHTTSTCLLTTFVALPLLNLECQVKGADREVDSLRIHSSHLADKKGHILHFKDGLSVRDRDRETDRHTNRLSRIERSVCARASDHADTARDLCCNRGDV